ncbi:MAG: WD40 repeat domain-containing protein [Chitinophagaceae bacterium]|nr:WD40 repeat domain-containing protein [Chitinophagaceae bacterium]
MMAFLCVVSDCAAQKIDIGTKQIINQMNGQGMALSPDGSYIVSNRRYGPGIQVYRRDEAGFKLAEVLGDYGTTGVFPQRFTVSHSGDMFLVANTDFTIYVFKRNAQNGFEKIQTLTPLEDIVLFFAFSPDDNFLVAGDHNVLKWYSVGSELKEVKTLAFHGQPLFVGQQQILIDAVMYSYTSNGELKQVQEMEEIKGVSVDFDSPEAIAISEDGQYLAVNERGKIDLLKRKGSQFEWLQKVDAEEDFNALAFSPDQSYLIAAEDNFVKTKLIVYQLKDDQLQMLTHEQGFQRGLESACFTPDGKLMIAATDEDLFLYPLKGIKGSKPLKKSAGPVVAKKEATPEKKEIPVKPVSNENRITIVWLNPNPDLLNDKPLVSDKPQFEIQIKIISDKPIDQKQLQIIINDKPESRQKFNEVSLKNSSPAQDGQSGYAYTFLKKIALENGLNQIQLKSGDYISPTKAKIMYSGAKPNLHILAIGTSLDLQFPQKDAADFAELFNGQDGQNKLGTDIHC